MSRRVAIVGAGPAGCVAAIILSRRGFDVLLIEQHRFPRDKVCGECLSRLGISVLESLGLAETIRVDCRPVELRRGLFFAQDGRRLEVPLPDAMWGIARTALDARLLAAAEGVRVCQPGRCERIASDPDGATLIVRDLSNNSTAAQRVDFVLLADGKGAGFDRPRTGDFGIKSHWAGIDSPPDAIALFGVDGHYGGIAPVEPGRFNVSFSVPGARLARFNGDLDRLFQQVIVENRALMHQMRSARRIGPWRASPVARFGVGGVWPERVIPLGNAAAAIEPIGGEGMGLAMRSAQIAADALAASSPDPVELRRRFARLWGARGPACRAAAGLISRPEVAAPVVELLGLAPAVTAAALRLIGK